MNRVTEGRIRNPESGIRNSEKPTPKSIPLLLVCVLVISLSFGQEEQWNERIQQLSSVYNSQSEYRLGPGDLIEVELYEIEDFEHELRISSKGMIRMPLLGTIEVVGMTPSELEEKLSGRTRKVKRLYLSLFVVVAESVSRNALLMP